MSDQDPTGANVLDLTVHNRYPVLAQRIANTVSPSTSTISPTKAPRCSAATPSWSASKRLKPKETCRPPKTRWSAIATAAALWMPTRTRPSGWTRSTHCNRSTLTRSKACARRKRATIPHWRDRTLPVSIVPNLTFERNPRIEADKSQLSQLEADRARMENDYTPKDPEMITNQTSIKRCSRI